MSISWGEMIGGAAAVTGVAVAGVGLGGEALAGVIGPETAVGSAISTAATKVGEVSLEAAKAVHLDGVLNTPEKAAAAAGGLLALVGGAVSWLFGKKHREEEEQDAQKDQAIAMLMQQNQQMREYIEENTGNARLPNKGGRGGLGR